MDNINELPKDKRPPDKLVWLGNPEDIDDFLDKVFGKKKQEPQEFVFDVGKIEG